MDVLGSIVGGIAGIVSLVCYILVLIQMFQHGQTGLGIACIVLLFCCGIGALIAFIYGWVNARQWNIRNIMMIWTVCVVINLIFTGLNYNTYRAQFQQQFQSR
jgi:hypothetical protein